MNDTELQMENDRLRDQNARLQRLVGDMRAKLAEPEDIIRAIRQGEIDALVVEQAGHDEVFAVQPFDSIYRAMVEETLPWGVWLAKPDGMPIYVSRRFLSLVKTSLREMREKGQFHFLEAPVREPIDREWTRCRATTEPFDVEYSVKGEDETERTIWTHAISARAMDGSTYWVGINLDVTERKHFQRELEQQAFALREADRRKDEFLATLAHELRNPLAPIRAAVHILKLSSIFDNDLQHALSMIDRQVKHMVRLIDDLLDVSRITHGVIELRREPVTLASVIEQAMDAARPNVEAGRHEIVLEQPVEAITVYADPIRLAQVFGNLINNACKYTQPGGRIRVVARRDGDDAVVSVIDNGIGIPADKLESIFEMFAQLDIRLERSSGGLGIGLTLAKRLVQLHGGAISAQSAGPGKGTELVVRLPVCPPLLERAQADAPEAPAVDCRRILVVDDNHDAALSLSKLLRISGHETTTAHDAPSAMEAAEKIRPEVILLDLGLPGVNGYEVCRQMRQQPWGRDARIIAVTGWGQGEDRRKSREAGFDGHFVKPVDYEALTRLLADLLPIS